MEDSQIAAALCAQLAARIGQGRYELWFGPTTRLRVDSAGLTIVAASTFVRDWLRRNFLDDIRACWDAIAGLGSPIDFAIDAEMVASSPNPACDPVDPPQLATQNGSDSECARPQSSRAQRTAAEPALVNFEIGPSNEYAFRSAELTAAGRQQASPVLWFGPTGVGKTHLLRAIVREYRRRHPRSRAVYLTAEQFTTGFIEALRGSGLPSFRQKCRGADLLAIDDLQFFVGKARTIEELQHTIDSLLAEGRQLALGADRPLVELRGLGPELWSRLAGGLVCEIEPPEFATRLGIVRRLRDELRLAIDDKLLEKVAGQITAGARELRGALYRLQIMSEAAGQPITSEMADEALRELTRQCTRAVRLLDVEHAVCDVFGVEPAQLKSDRKGRALSEPRMLAMWLARKYTRMPWSEIGQYFGRRSHSTVIAAHRRVERLITSQAEIGLNNRPCNVEEAIRRLETALRTA